MKRTLSFTSMVIMLAALAIGCNDGCTHLQQSKNSFDGYSSNSENAERGLTQHIADRTVRISIMCKIVDDKGVVRKDYYQGGWGSGAIVLSTEKYSLIQTANHIVDNEIVSQENLSRICDQYQIEKRDLNNKIILTYSGKTEVVAQDNVNDIAVIKVFINLGYSSAIAKNVSIGQEIRILAYPSLRGIKDPQLSYSKGYIATINMGKENNLRNADDQIRIATFGYFGSSGGAVWNLRGELIGVVTLLTGFNTLGGYVPQQDCLYGPSIAAIRNFYIKNRLPQILEN